MATNCEEWMNYMLYRVSSLDMLSGPNLTAVTIMVRFDEAMKLYTISSKKIEEQLTLTYKTWQRTLS